MRRQRSLAGKVTELSDTLMKIQANTNHRRGFVASVTALLTVDFERIGRYLGMRIG